MQKDRMTRIRIVTFHEDRTFSRSYFILKLIKTADDLKVFMAGHIYCVWDFMNLIKKLQITFTSTTLPFRPATDFVSEQVRRFLNEIVLEEESDEIEDSFISHFSYYKKG